MDPVSNSTLAVFDVIDEVVAPIRAEVPERPSVMEFFDPQFQVPACLEECALPRDRDLVAEVEEYLRFVTGMSALGLAPGGQVTPEAIGLYRALRGGFIRGVVTGVFAERREPWEVRFFGDEDFTTVLSKAGDQARLRAGFLSTLPGWVFDGLPEREAGPGEIVVIQADEHGLIEPDQHEALAAMREAVARPRLGTVLVDLTVRDAVCAEYPHGAFGLVDNDLGRYLFSASLDGDRRWTIWWCPATRSHAERWIAESVRRHA
ncbi:ESX secretion-associated protein EspG [Amycolatopsis sp. NPDC059657]|uniref:ESX secretion-associated protein EspG n=1 Tax=Amycolatopsis sp. NPDC059657 TaxID=3346899 RepID=UPI003670D6A9